KWERTGILNFGMDFGTKGNRISGSVDYFAKNNIDLIGESQINPTTGFETYRGNLASTNGNGIDIILNTVNFQDKFGWSTQLQFSYAVDKVTAYKTKPLLFEFYADQSVLRAPITYRPVMGKPLFGIYSHRWAGLNPETGDPQGYLKDEASTDYTAINNELASDPENMLVYHGRALPPTFGALRNTLSYGGVKLSFNISYRFGYF